MQKFLDAGNQQEIKCMQGKYIRKPNIKYGATGKHWKASGKHKDTGSFQFKTLNKDIAYLLGAYMSDGCIYTSKKGWKMFTLEVIDKDFAENTQTSINNILETNKRMEIYQRISPRDENRILYKTYSGNQELCNWIEDITGKKQYIPDIVLCANPVLQKEFIAGILDGEGWALTRKNSNGNIQIGFAVCSSWIFEIAEIMKMLGINITKISRETHGRKRPLWRMNINVMSFVQNGFYFKIERKQQRVLNWKNIHFKSSETKRTTSERMMI